MAESDPGTSRLDDERETPREERRWRLWQVETSMACELSCTMCPWHGVRRQVDERQLMSAEVWSALLPFLEEVDVVDFSGGGEPLLHPSLPRWIAEASKAGCEVGFLSNAHSFDEARARAVLEAGVGWLAFSFDGADAAVYETIRRGGSFELVTGNIRRMVAMRCSGGPRVALNFVILQENIDQLERVVELAAELGVDQVNFKQCDVSRGEHGSGRGLFRRESNREVRGHEKRMKRALRTARRLGLETTAFSFVADEQPVCDQDPTRSLFIRWDGRVAPCINKAYGGPTSFFGDAAEMPTTHYGDLHEESLLALWQGSICRRHRETFARRAVSYWAPLRELGPGTTMEKLEEAFRKGRRSMPPPPAGCEVCHYLFGV